MSTNTLATARNELDDTKTRPAVAGRLAVFLALLAGLVWSYWPTLSDLGAFWIANSDYSAGALVPLVAGWVIWSERKELAKLPVGTCWSGLALLVFAQGIRMYGLLYMYGSLERLSLVLTIVAACLLLVGRPITWRLRYVLLFLVLMFPLPNRVHDEVAMPLQTFASNSAVVGLEMMGYLISQEGNVLRLSDRTTVAVAEACSGLRMLTAFVVVAGALAFVVNRPTWQKATVVASSIPVAIFSNTIRLILTVILFEHVGSELGEKFFHDIAGYLMIPFAWAVLMGELWLLRWITGGETDEEEKTVRKHAPAGRRVVLRSQSRSQAPAWQVFAARASRPGAVAALAAVVTCGFGYRVLAAKIDVALAQTVPLLQSLSTVPLQLGPWQGQDIPLDETVRRIAGEDDYLNRQYVNDGTGRSIGLYVGYLGRPRSRMGHRPDVCYITHGFKQLSEEPVVIDGSDGERMPALLYEFEPPQMGAPHQLVMVLYSVNGKYVNSVASANSYNTRGAGLISRDASYAGRIQVAMSASGDRTSDVRTLSTFAAMVAEPIEALMPETTKQ